MRSAPAFLVFPLVAACAGAPGRSLEPAPAVAPAVTALVSATDDTTWYVTNRARQGAGFSRTAADSLEKAPCFPELGHILNVSSRDEGAAPAGTRARHRF